MSTIQTTLRAGPNRTRVYFVSALGTLAAIGLAILFLALAAGIHRSPATSSHRAASYQPLIHYRGTGAAPFINPETGQMHGRGVLEAAGAAGAHTTARTSPAQHKSYGAVP